MRRAPKEYRRTRVIVSGKGHFPTGLLTEDTCVPETVKDVVSVQGYSTIMRDVCLSRFSLDGRKVNPAQWKRFHWTVTFDNGVE